MYLDRTPAQHSIRKWETTGGLQRHPAAGLQPYNLLKLSFPLSCLTPQASVDACSSDRGLPFMLHAEFDDLDTFKKLGDPLRV